jgi:hypothetical protein
MRQKTELERAVGIVLFVIAAILALFVLYLRFFPGNDNVGQVITSGGTPTVSPYQAGEIAANYVSQTYNISSTDLQFVDAGRQKDDASGEERWFYKLMDKRTQRTYDVAVDDYGQVVP